MKRGAVFVTGIHGVGKTTLCEHMSRSFEIPAFRASALIRKFVQADSTPARLNCQVLRNAEVFRDAIPIVANSNPTFFVDGHTVLLDSDAKFVRIPPRIFSDLGILALILVYHDVEEIRSRLKNSIPNDPAFIAAFQSAEITQASLVADQLGIELLAWHGSERIEGIQASIDHLLTSKND